MAIKMIDASNLPYMIRKIKEVTDTKVDKVDGKGLSTNDYTDEEKEKLNNISTVTISELNDLFNTNNTTE